MSDTATGGVEAGAAIEVAPTTPQFEGNSWQAPTMNIDGLAGVAMSNNQIKISFAEHFPTPDRLVGKYVLNIVVANDQFLKIADALTAIAEKMRKTGEQGE